MIRSRRMTACVMALVILMGSQMPAQALVGLAMLGDRYLKQQAKIALNTPGHAQWCAKRHPGFRKEWNTYPRGDGRVRYCASPFYTPPWQKWLKSSPTN